MLVARLRRLLAVAILTACGAPSEDPVATDGQSIVDGAKETEAPALPLKTSGRFIVDQNGRRVKLVSASWYGAESPDLVPGGLDRQSVDAIAASIRSLGFNSVRLPWSNELVRWYRRDPSFRLAPTPATLPAPEEAVVAHVGLVAQNPGFAELHPFEIFERTVEALTDADLLVVLDNHTSRADWCCDDWDGNGLWYRADPNPADRYTEDDWLDDWRLMAERFGKNPRVIGAELRNELRPAFGVTPTWGGPPDRDWKRAAELGGNAVLAIAPHWLVFVDGLDWSGDLSGAYRDPIRLEVEHRLVYAPHDYAWFHPTLGLTGYDDLPGSMRDKLGKRWGFLLRQDEPYTAPVWVSEIGTCTTSTDCFTSTGRGSQGYWYEGIVRYLAEADIDWAWWPINATQSSQRPDSYRRASNKRRNGASESYALFGPDWSVPSASDPKARLLETLAPIRAATEP